MVQKLLFLIQAIKREREKENNISVQKLTLSYSLIQLFTINQNLPPFERLCYCHFSFFYPTFTLDGEKKRERRITLAYKRLLFLIQVITMMNYKLITFVLQVYCYFYFSLTLPPLRDRKKRIALAYKSFLFLIQVINVEFWSATFCTTMFIPFFLQVKREREKEKGE